MASIRLEAIHKSWPGGPTALEGVDLAVADRELLVLVGPSGCGKSTALRLVAGLETPTRGRIWIGERDVTDLSPGDRDVAMVFQSYALYPHKSVRDNLAFGLRMRSADREEIARRVSSVAQRLALEDVLDRRPAQLSGGQRQRVALGRALVREPQAFLLDEPLSNLDARLRTETRAELARIQRALGATMLYVTHDQEEAMTLGDRIAVLRDGRVEQLAPPLDVYARPASVFVADFIGAPRMNWFGGRLARDAGRLVARCGGFRVDVPGLASEAAREGREITLGVRPQDLRPAPPDDADLRGRVEVREALGSTLLVHARSDRGDELRVLVPVETPVAIGEPIGVRIDRHRVHLFDTSSGARLD